MPLGARKKAEEARAATDTPKDTAETEKDAEKTNSTEKDVEESTDDVDALRLQLKALRKSSDAEITKLKDELSAGHVELGSLRRNHQANIKKVEGERDMFAAALAQEQGQGKSGGGIGGRVGGMGSRSSSKVEEVEAQLRAARVRNGDLEEENVGLRQENKQMLLRLQANKTLGAESGAYDKLVADLVDVKLKLALAQEQSEEQTRSVKGIKDTNNVLRTANGDLEKSRQEWVLKCANLEKEKEELQQKIEGLEKQLESATKSGFSPSRLSNELQQIPLWEIWWIFDRL